MEVSKPPSANDNEWLLENTNLRMDANSDFYPEVRRRFHIARYMFAQPYCANVRVLDGACGTGYGSAILGEVATHVYGIDIDHKAIEYARKTYGNMKVEFQRAFVEATEFESNYFDRIVSFETIEHTLCPRSHIMEIARLLEPTQGQAILSVPNAWGLTAHHFVDFDFGLLQEYVSHFFEQAEYFYQNPESHATLPGIGVLTATAPSNAQCILAVCERPKKNKIAINRYDYIIQEIYERAFQRHQEYLSLAYRANTTLIHRAYNKASMLFKSWQK